MRPKISPSDTNFIVREFAALLIVHGCATIERRRRLAPVKDILVRSAPKVDARSAVPNAFVSKIMRKGIALCE